MDTEENSMPLPSMVTVIKEERFDFDEVNPLYYKCRRMILKFCRFSCILEVYVQEAKSRGYDLKTVLCAHNIFFRAKYSFFLIFS